MTNIYLTETLVDEQNGAPVKVEIGKTPEGEFHFRFGNNPPWRTSLRDGYYFRELIRSVMLRQDKAWRKQTDCKPATKPLGPFELGLDLDGGFYLRVMPNGRFVYLNYDALKWFAMALRQTLLPPEQRIKQMAIRPDDDFPPSWSL